MVAIIDYGVGNLFSLASSLRMIGADAVVTSDREEIKKADSLILPGVGAFEDAAYKLFSSGLDKVIKEECAAGKPLLGICLGMQLLFDKSFEYGEHKGLSLIKGSVIAMKGKIDPSLDVPHMGWNSLSLTRESRLFKYIKDNDFVYFVHSYYAAECDESVIAVSEYSIPITAAVESGKVFGCQFHPEKSGEVGLSILRAFCEIR